MAGEFQVRIEVQESGDSEKLLADSQWLIGVQQDMERELDVPCVAETAAAPADVQGVDIMTAIGIVNASVAVLGLVWNIVNVRLPKGSITVERTYKDGTKVTEKLEGLTPEKLKEYEREVRQEVGKSSFESVVIKKG